MGNDSEVWKQASSVSTQVATEIESQLKVSEKAWSIYELLLELSAASLSVI